MNSLFPFPQPPVKEGNLSVSRPGTLEKKMLNFVIRFHTKKKEILFYKNF